MESLLSSTHPVNRNSYITGPDVGIKHFPKLQNMIQTILINVNQKLIMFI